jgi:large subunit ribosomal protein L10e
MAKLRKFCAYRRLERPYTRISKYKKRSYVKADPRIVITRFAMGEPRKKFPYTLELAAKSNLQIRHNALESARMTCNRLLETKLGKTEYHLKLMVYPFHILRENPLAAGAGADRFSTGMAHSYGTPISSAAQVKKGKVIFSLGVNKQNLVLGRLALKRAQYKIPCTCTINVIENK